MIWPALGLGRPASRFARSWICLQVDLPGGLRYTPRTSTAATNLHLQSRFPDMKIFLDSADINEIKTYINTGFVDGVTTNPSLIAKYGS